jgi:hypothetical protein
MYILFFDQILFSVSEKSYQCLLLLWGSIADSIANVDKKVGNPGSKLLVKGCLECLKYLFKTIQRVFSMLWNQAALSASIDCASLSVIAGSSAKKPVKNSNRCIAYIQLSAACQMVISAQM